MQHKQRHIPERMCVICRERRPKERMTRYVCPGNSGEGLRPDPQGKSQGRGFYLCGERSCEERFPRFKAWRRKCKEVADDR